MEDITPKYTIEAADTEVNLPTPFPAQTTSTTVGGFNAAAGFLSQGNLSFNSAGEQILVGSATAPLTGAGVFIGRDTDGTYDFRAGDPSGSYIHWDASASTLTVNGSINIINNFTAGQDLTKGMLVCLINTTATWGDQANSTTNKSTTATLSAFTYVDQASPASAAGAAPSNVKLGASGGSLWMYGKIDLASAPPGLPTWNEIDRVALRLYVTTAATGSVNDVTFSRLTASFTESTITWNTKPADDGVNWASGSVAAQTLNLETCASTGDTKNTGYIEFDITELYKLWSQGTYTNNGFVIKGGATASIANFGGRSVTNGGAFNQAPFVVSIIVKDNPGSGTTFAASDGKVYAAKHSNYQYAKHIVGIVGADTLSGGTVPVYALSDRAVIPSSVLTVVTGRNYYLMDDSGTIGTLTNDIIESGFYDRKIGIGTSSGLSIDFDTSPLLIRTVTILGSGLLPPPNARYAIAAVQYTSGGNTFYATFRLDKSFFSSETITITEPAGVPRNVVVAWASGTSGLLTSTNATQTSVSWFR
jgi:hypothetical protein